MGSPALSMQAAPPRPRTNENPRENTDRRAGWRPWSIESAGEPFNVHSWDLKSLAFRRPLPVGSRDGALPTDRPHPLRHQVPPGVDYEVPQEDLARRRRPPAPSDRSDDLYGAGGRDPQGAHQRR